MTYIGSVKDAEKAMSDERRMDCPEGVEDFAGIEWKAVEHMTDQERVWVVMRWFDRDVPTEEFSKRFFCADPALFQPPAMAEAAEKIEAHLAKGDDGKAQACADAFQAFAEKMAASGPITPYLAVPRSAPTADARRIAALEAELAAARAALAAAADQARELTGQKPEAAQNPLKRAIAAWPGYGGISQLTGKPRWV